MILRGEWDVTTQNRDKRVPALGTRVQIGQFFNGHNRKILTAYPRMFSDDEYKQVTTGDTYSVSYNLYQIHWGYT